MNLHHVDSKQTMLSVEDILMVTAHDLKKAAQDMYKKAGSPEGVSPERVLYTVFVKLNQQPNFIRLREGNTLALLVPETKTSAMLFLYNADKLSRLQDNFTKLAQAAAKMGYRKVWGPLARDEHGNDKMRDIYKSLESNPNFKTTMTKDRVELEFAP